MRLRFFADHCISTYIVQSLQEAGHMDRVELLSQEMISTIRSKTPAERLQVAFSLSRLAGKRLEAYLRYRYPGWDTDRINQEIARRIASGSK